MIRLLSAFSIVFLASLALCSKTFAGKVYFETSDGERFWTYESTLTFNMDPNGHLAAFLKRRGEQGVRDGTSPETAIEMDINGRLFKKYLLDLLRYGEVTFKNSADAENTFRLAEELGLPAAKNFIARSLNKYTDDEVLEILNDLGEFIPFQGATFVMGASAQERSHFFHISTMEVTLSPFEIAEAGVTQKLWFDVMRTNPSQFQLQHHCPESYQVMTTFDSPVRLCPEHPVERVSWYDVNSFTEKLNEALKPWGYRYRLPTEAEFEFAIRGGTHSTYITGYSVTDDLLKYVWCNDNAKRQTHPVKSVEPNQYGFYRSSVREWASDFYEDYPKTPQKDPLGPPEGYQKVVRGEWFNSRLQDFKSAQRHCHHPDTKSESIGFRLVREKLN